jgi:hypothetical protein
MRGDEPFLARWLTHALWHLPAGTEADGNDAVHPLTPQKNADGNDAVHPLTPQKNADGNDAVHPLTPQKNADGNDAVHPLTPQKNGGNGTPGKNAKPPKASGPGRSVPTPDFLMLSPGALVINGRPVAWIDAKCYCLPGMGPKRKEV